MEETPDAEYLARTIGQPLSLAVAEVCIVQPADPIEWLSAWLYKYVDSAEWLKAYKREQWEKSSLDGQSKRQVLIQAQKESEQNGLRISSCNYLSTLKDDPFNLWKNAIKAVTTFTGFHSHFMLTFVVLQANLFSLTQRNSQWHDKIVPDRTSSKQNSCPSFSVE